MDVTFKHTPKSQAVHKNAMFLCNHRSWSDFYFDQALCNGGAYLSRLLVIPACPGSSLYAWLAHSTWFFNRKKGIDRDALGSYIQGQWLMRPNSGVVVYPEGTRNAKMEPLKLKTGVLKMAFDYKRPVQCVITTNKEAVSNEKDFTFQRGMTCVTSISKVLQPEDHETFEDFVTAVRKLFADTWEDAYGCDPKDAMVCHPPHGVPTPGFEPLPQPMRAWFLRFLLAALVYLWHVKNYS